MGLVSRPFAIPWYERLERSVAGEAESAEELMLRGPAEEFMLTGLASKTF